MAVFRHGIFWAFVVLLGVAVTGIAQTADDSKEGFFIVKQGDVSSPLVPVRENNSALIFYNFNNDQSNTGLEVPEHSLIVLHVDASTGNVSLILLLSSAQNPAGGSANLTIDGLPDGATLDLSDDPTDTYVFAPPSLQASWQWLPEHSDGVIIGNLGQDFSITITPNFISGITQWDTIDGTTRAPNALPSLVEPVTIVGTRNAPPSAHFTVSPEVLNINVGITFDAATSSDSDGVIVQYEWDFDGDGTFEVSTPSPSIQHAFTQGGTTDVTLRVTDDAGGTANFTQTFIVAEEIVSAVRTISTPQTLPGLAFRVTVDLSMRADVNGLGVDETLPPSWDITPIDNAGATFKRSQNQWVFPSILRAGESRRIVYDVTVRSQGVGVGPLPVRLDIDGVVDSAAPAFRTPVLGEKSVEVTTCLSIPVALAHMDPNTDVVDLRQSEGIAFDQVQRAVTFWIEEIGVPQTCDALVGLDLLKEITARELLNAPVDGALQLTDFSQQAAPTLTRKVLTPLPFHQVYLQARGGNTFQVQLDVTADQDYNGLGLNENLPETWQLQPIDNNGAAFNPRTREWLFTDRLLRGETRTVIYEVTIPSDESSGTFSISGVASSAAPAFQAAVENDSFVELVECLSVPVAISHLDTESETIDISLSNQINFNQVQVAIGFWLEDQEVVGGCGQTIGFDDVKTLIAFWLTDTPVDHPLGANFSEPSSSSGP